MSGIEDQIKDCSHHWDYCTEILGFESVMEKIDGGDFPAPEKRNDEKEKLLGVGKVEKASKEKVELGLGLKFFPPLLTTLSEDGRPIFNLKKLSESNGRLRIAMVRKKQEIILRCRRGAGRLLIWIVPSGLGDECDTDDNHRDEFDTDDNHYYDLDQDDDEQERV